MQQKFTLPQSWLEWLGLVTVVVVAVFAFSLYPATDARRWAVLGLMALFFVSQLWPAECEIQPGVFDRREHLRLAFLTLLTLGMFALDVNFTAIIILYFILSGRALSLFPNHVGYVWVFLFGALTTSLMT